MIFQPTTIDGLTIIDIEPHQDHRGFFARVWCREEFARHGLPNSLEQCSIAFNRRRGTLRGIHWQEAPHGEEKLIRCTRGAIFVVAVDVRGKYPSTRRIVTMELSAENHRMVFIPKGCAVGYQTLADETELVYQMSQPYVPDAACGMRYDDPALNIDWPLEVTEISDADRNWSYMVSESSAKAITT